MTGISILILNKKGLVDTGVMPRLCLLSRSRLLLQAQFYLPLPWGRTSCIRAVVPLHKYVHIQNSFVYTAS